MTSEGIRARAERFADDLLARLDRTANPEWRKQEIIGALLSYGFETALASACDVRKETQDIRVGAALEVSREGRAGMTNATEHTDACYAMPECLTCGRRKKPYGRDAGLAAANGYCGEDCPGYREEPRAGHFWPEERSEVEKGEQV